MASGSEAIEEVAKGLIPLGKELNPSDFNPKSHANSKLDHDDAEMSLRSQLTADEVVKWVELIPLVEIFALARVKTSQHVIKASDILDQGEHTNPDNGAELTI